MSNFAQIDENGNVIRVIVCDSQEWCESRLGGTWIETKIDDPEEQYAGIGYGVEPDHPKKFAPQWTQPVPGISEGFSVGAYAWHGGKIWQSTTPTNVWEPGVFGWRDKTDTIPSWRQPLGAGDAWALNDEVLHANRHYRSLHAANVWEPGAVGSESLWIDITVTEPPQTVPAWVQPTGSEDAYAIGNRVTHDNPNDASAIWIYESAINANTTQPGRDGTFDRWWTPIEAA